MAKRLAGGLNKRPAFRAGPSSSKKGLVEQGFWQPPQEGKSGGVEESVRSVGRRHQA
ncbi:hypothetical protein EMIT0P253_120094 [Pseudomonas sp. IT-P253]